MKALLLLALIALVASTAFAQYLEVRNEDAEVHGEVECQQEQVSLGACQDYVKDRCRSMKFPITQPWKWRKPWKWTEPWKWGMSSCDDVQKRCCEELAKVSMQCRCMAIKRTIQGDIMLRFQPGRMSKVMEKAKSLPVLCNMPPSDCKSMANGYY
uniref:Uncharacterized protein n=1 Tax=Avena sativa TaxID=4498 RepID=A0ACD5X328_AVESA